MQWPQTGGQGSAAALICPADLSSLAPSQALLLLYVSQVARCSVGRWGSKPDSSSVSATSRFLPSLPPSLTAFSLLWKLAALVDYETAKVAVLSVQDFQ